MGLLKKLFGSNEPAKQPADPSQDPSLIRVFDKYGREGYITKEDWRSNVLPSSIKSSWNDPDQLYGVIYHALNDGLVADVADAAQQLYRIDSQPHRGACLWGVVLMEQGRLDDAEKVLRDFIATHGEEGTILTNLAKVYSRRNDNATAEKILWHALEVDPNQENGFDWYEAIYRQRGGVDAGQEAVRRVAALPTSWRAQLWLARTALNSGDLTTALSLYYQCLECLGSNAPTNALMQMSGDLGNAGQLREIIRLVEPRFDPAVHGKLVGNNLIKAHLELREFDDARRILDQLFALNRPDWKEFLNFWDAEIAKARIASMPVDQSQMEMAMLTIEGPVWQSPSSPSAQLFPAKAPGAKVIMFLGSSAEVATDSQQIQHQLSNSPGRLSRALPLFMAEQVEFGSRARTITLIPWIVKPSSGFVFSGVAWNDEIATHSPRQVAPNCEFLVITHIKTQVEPWTIELRMVRTTDGQCAGQLTADVSISAPTEGICSLALQLLDLLSHVAKIELEQPPSLYTLPTGANFAQYLLRLEQLLAVRCGGMDGVSVGFLSGEREIIDGSFQLCLEMPQSANVRILLAQILLSMKRVRPDILPEFKDRVTFLQNEHPLLDPAQEVVQRLLNDALT